MKLLERLRQSIRNADDVAKSLRELISITSRLADSLDRKSDRIVKQNNLLSQKFDIILEYIAQSNPDTRRRIDKLHKHLGVSVDEVLAESPLIIADRTYNTSHPDYDARVVRNFPGRIFNADCPSTNVAFDSLKKAAAGNQVDDAKWGPILADALAEASSVGHAGEVFERRAFIESYMAELSRKHQAHYLPGWVNIDDALFLYWLVRQTKPKKIVQCGVCNGLSSAFMMLALVKNGPDGTLSVIDLPPIFDPNDAEWTIAEKVYGFVIPEGKTTGWIVPDAYRDRLQVLNGDSKELLPKLIDEFAEIDFFYHDSDHTYNHMKFEFQQAKRKLAAGGLIVADDISWNASLWDFADQYSAPGFNFKGAVGVAFF